MSAKVKKVSVSSDPIVSLKFLKTKIEEWIEKYGEDAVFSTDAGYNNVELMIDTSKKAISRNKSYGEEL